MEMTVDVGNNIASLVERLAQQIGTTADQVFPWYVHQAYLQGVTSLASMLLALVIAVAVFVPSFRRADFDEGNRATVLSVISGGIILLSLATCFVTGPQQVRKMLNPQFYAVTMLAEDIGKMRGGR